ncbi:Trp biosynthesis-associated membrane protein [Saccharopolyspora rosea]|uniref:Trp biosynthesis-associated membrane protein n=1 Tax=Saccharopolyspora rosea TaxID=524884 RepID=UPI003383CDE1
MLLLLAAAGLLWGSGALRWVDQSYRTPFSGQITAGADGSVVRAELVPLALASLAAIAAVLATGGWLRRVVGAVVVVAGGLVGWRAATGFRLSTFHAVNVPSGSTPVGAAALHPVGPLLMALGAVALFVGGLLVLLRADRMPAMGAKYSAPGATERRSQDPDRRMWDDLDHGRDPTDEDR